LKSEIQNPKSEIQNPKSEIRNPKSEIRNPLTAKVAKEAQRTQRFSPSLRELDERSEEIPLAGREGAGGEFMG
jgi:hypothetical protein